VVRVRLPPISIEGDVLDGPQTNDTEKERFQWFQRFERFERFQRF
jgi:hypothetical protein